MDEQKDGEKKAETTIPPAILIRGAIRIVLAIVFMGATLFISAGSFQWKDARTLLGLFFIIIIINLLVLIKWNPGVIEERMNVKKGTKKWDLVLGSVIGVLSIGILVIAGLDERYGWSPDMAHWIRMLAIAMCVLSDLFFLWAMAVNKYFAKFMRIQEDRGHTVVTDGPYQYIRHPGYVGWTFMWITLPVILGSLWAFLPVGVSIILILVRTAWEDKCLMEELEGYPEYSHKVRFRLIPGLW